jgi:transposase
VKRVGLEAGPLSQWLHAGLKRAGFDTLLLETRHVKAALSAMMVKTDRKDARGLAQLIRMGWFRPVHAKSMGSQEVRALLVARKQLLGRLIDVELSIRGILRDFGLKVGVVTRKGFEGRIRELVTGHITLERIAGAMLSARATLKVEYEKLHKIVLTIVREDAVCRRLMTVPSVGPLVAITYKSAMDPPNRIAKSKSAGALHAFRHSVAELWQRSLRRRSQRDGMSWERFTQLANDWLPKPRILHPWPERRFAVKHPRWEPYA